MANTTTAASRQIRQKFGSYDPNRQIQIRYSYYDYIQYPSAGAASIAFFNVPQGASDAYNNAIVKTAEQTNVTIARQFNDDFILKQIRTHIRIVPKGRQAAANKALTKWITSPDAATGLSGTCQTLARLSLQGTMLITIGQKLWYDIPQPFITCPPGFGLEHVQHAATPAASGLVEADWFVQDNNPDCIYNVPTQLIEAGQTIAVQVLFDNASSPALPNIASSTPANVEIGLILDGFSIQNIQ